MCMHPVGDGLPDSIRVYRVKVVTAMLKAGVPLGKIEENGIGPSKGVQNTHQKRSVEGLWAKCQSVQ